MMLVIRVVMIILSFVCEFYENVSSSANISEKQ